MTAEGPAWVWLDGRIVPEAEATIPVADRGFVYGDGLFETLRTRRGRVFRLDRHLDRLARGAAAIGFLAHRLVATVTWSRPSADVQ